MIAQIKNPLIRRSIATVSFVAFLPVAWVLGATASTAELFEAFVCAWHGE